MTGKNITFKVSLRFRWIALVGFSLALVHFPTVTRSLAADPPPLSSTIQLPPLDLDALKPDRTPHSVVTATTISQFGLTVPSLWWIREQIAAVEAFGGKLLQNWLAYPPSKGSGVGRVDLVVNRQLWSLMDYLERYEVIHHFSTAARDFGYNVRVFDDRANFLGAYICDFRIAKLEKAVTSQLEPPPTCNLVLDAGGKSGLRGGSNLFNGGSPKVPDTVEP
jgi:hypothetical protein